MTFALFIPLLPLAAFMILGLFGRKIHGHSHRVTVPALFLSFVFSILTLFEVLRNETIRLDLYTFIHSGSLVVEMGLYVDPLAALMLILVTGVSSLVHVFSSRYMQGDPRYARFFAVMSLFSFAMLMLVMSTNLLMLYLFWEIMGLCSYLLISHWAERKSACDSAIRAFLVNAVADVGLGLGVLVTFVTFGTLDIQQVLAGAQAKVGQTMNLLGWLGMEWQVEVITLIAILLFIGAMGKSAQFPLHVWLPYAMEAPTPVSALIHAATMVKAGIFLLARLAPLLILSPAAMNLVAVIGAITALLAATIAVTQSDIKKILAYSTMSQLGFMVMASGLGAFLAAIFHLLAHGALKAFLFLSSGSALQNLPHRYHPEGKDDGHRHASLRPPVAPYALILAWLPPVLMALNSYGLLWWSPRSNGLSPVFWPVVLGTSFLTAIYLFRGITLISRSSRMVDTHGQSVGIYSASKASERERLHPALPVEGATLAPTIDGLPDFPVQKPPETRTAPSGVGVALVVGALATMGWAGLLVFLWDGFAHFLSPAVAQSAGSVGYLHENPSALPLMASGIIASLAGWGLAHYFSVHAVRLSPGLGEGYKRLYVLIHNKWYFDEIYDAFIVRPNLRFAQWLWRTIDVQVIERWVIGLGSCTVAFARWLWQVVDIRILGWVVDGIGHSTVALARWLWQSVDIRMLGWMVDGTGRSTVGLAQWLWQSVDIRGLERFIGGIGHQNEAAGQVLREMEPSMLQHQLLVLIFSLGIVMGLFLLLFL